MPQMAPLWWGSLFFTLFFITSVIIYHLSKSYSTKTKGLEKTTNQMIWKW